MTDAENQWFVKYVLIYIVVMQQTQQTLCFVWHSSVKLSRKQQHSLSLDEFCFYNNNSNSASYYNISRSVHLFTPNEKSRDYISLKTIALKNFTMLISTFLSTVTTIMFICNCSATRRTLTLGFSSNICCRMLLWVSTSFSCLLVWASSS